MTQTREIIFERTYDASLEAIWRAWTNSDMLKQWWGPNDVFIPECEIDLRVGGKFYLVMEATEAMGSYKGVRWPMNGTYTLVEENAKLSYDSKAWTEGHEKTTEINQTTELLLTSDNGKTTLNLKVTIHKIGSDAKAAVEGIQWGFNQQFDKLRIFLGKEIISRV